MTDGFVFLLITVNVFSAEHTKNLQLHWSQRVQITRHYRCSTVTNVIFKPAYFRFSKSNTFSKCYKANTCKTYQTCDCVFKPFVQILKGQVCFFMAAPATVLFITSQSKSEILRRFSQWWRNMVGGLFATADRHKQVDRWVAKLNVFV